MSQPMSRRSFVRRAALTTAAVATGADALANAATPKPALATTSAGGDLSPVEPIAAILNAMGSYPLVAIGEFHQLQEWHDLIGRLLFHPSLPGRITDIAVEFGNAYYQHVADRFVLSGEPVSNKELAQIWQVLGWDPPVYEQFFRNVRAINWMLPPERRIRVLLGTPPFNTHQVSTRAEQRAFTAWWNLGVDGHYADMVEQEVMAKGRRALLLAGSGHLLRGLQSDQNPNKLAAGGILAQRHPGSMFVVDTLILPPGAGPDDAATRLKSAFAGWPRPSLAMLADTWLGQTSQRLGGGYINTLADRAATPAASEFASQADAILYLGPGELLTASRQDPAIYHWGAYAQQLRRLDPLVSRAQHQPTRLENEGLAQTRGGPQWFSQSSPSGAGKHK